MRRIIYIVIRRLWDREAIGIVEIPNDLLVCGAYNGPNSVRSNVFLDEITETEYTSYEALGMFSVYGWKGRADKVHVDLFNKDFFETCPSVPGPTR